jgi:hypothetical protein
LPVDFEQISGFVKNSGDSLVIHSCIQIVSLPLLWQRMRSTLHPEAEEKGWLDVRKKAS